MREAHLRDLIAVIEAGSVRAAARKLGLTQAAVSKNLSALERQLGVPLLVRSAHGVEPTAYGRLALRRARVVDAELRHLHEEIGSLHGDTPAEVTVGLSATAEAMLLPTALARFRASSPQVLVSLFGGRSASTVVALREARVDFAVGPLPPDEGIGDLHVERLCSTDLGIVVRAGHPAADCRDLAELAGYGWLFSVRQLGAASVRALFAERGLAPPAMVACSDSSSALVSLLLQDDYVTQTSLAAIEPYRSQGLLKVLPIGLGSGQVVQHLMIPALRPLTAQAALLAAEFRRASRRYRR